MRAAPSFADGASIRLMHTTAKRCLSFYEAKTALRGEKRTPQSIILLWGARQALLTDPLAVAHLGRAGLDGVKDEGERAPRLPSMLRSKAEEDDTPSSHRDFRERDLARDAIL